MDEIQLFMPKDSNIRVDASWVEENFRDELRFESVIVEADNVLTPPVLAAVSQIAVILYSCTSFYIIFAYAGYLKWFITTQR